MQTRFRRRIKAISAGRVYRRKFMRRLLNSGSVVDKPQAKAAAAKSGIMQKLSSAFKSVTRRQSSRGG